MPPDLKRGGAPTRLPTSGYFAVNESGEEITRPALCALCGSAFKQRILSERFMSVIEKRGPQAMALLRRQVPDFWCPRYCPTCERKDLGHQGRIADLRGAA